MTKAVLFSYFRSSSAYRVRIALNLKKVPYEIRTVNLLQGEQSSLEFKAISPLGAVPVLQIDGHTLTQSLAIIDYLDAMHKEPRMCPSGEPVTRSQILSLAMTMAGDMQPLHNMYTLISLTELANADDNIKKEWIKRFLTRGFNVIEHEIARLSENGRFCVGDSVSLADVCLAPQVYVANRFKLEMEAFPKTLGVYKNLMGLEPFITAHPHNQTDCPQELLNDLSLYFNFCLTKQVHRNFLYSTVKDKRYKDGSQDSPKRRRLRQQRGFLNGYKFSIRDIS